MIELVEPLRPVRILVKPKRFAPLKGFSCGGHGRPWEKAVNDWICDIYAGRTGRGETVVVLEDAVGRLVGVASFEAEPIPIRMGGSVRNTQRLHMLGTDRHWRGRRLKDGSSPGDALLFGTLKQIEHAFGGRMPYVWALVSPGNDRSHALFSRHGFDQLPYPGEGEMVRIRSPGRLRVISLRAPVAACTRVYDSIRRTAKRRPKPLRAPSCPPSR